MGCNCNKKITTDVSTSIVYDLPDLVRSVYQYDMDENNVPDVTNDEWKAFFYTLNLFGLFKLINIEKYIKEFFNLGGCTICFDNIIEAFCSDKRAEKNKAGTSLFLSSKKRS